MVDANGEVLVVFIIGESTVEELSVVAFVDDVLKDGINRVSVKCTAVWENEFEEKLTKLCTDFRLESNEVMLEVILLDVTRENKSVVFATGDGESSEIRLDKVWFKVGPWLVDIWVVNAVLTLIDKGVFLMDGGDTCVE